MEPITIALIIIAACYAALGIGVLIGYLRRTWRQR